MDGNASRPGQIGLGFVCVLLFAYLWIRLIYALANVAVDLVGGAFATWFSLFLFGVLALFVYRCVRVFGRDGPKPDEGNGIVEHPPASTGKAEKCQ